MKSYCMIATVVTLWLFVLTLETFAYSLQVESNQKDETTAIVLSPSLQKLVPAGCPVRDVRRTTLSTKHELIIVCTRDFLADQQSTHVVITDGQFSVLKDIDLGPLSPANGGFNRFDTAREISGPLNHHILALVFATAGDGSGSDFFIIGHRNGTYQILLHRLVSLGKIVFHPQTNSIDIWGSGSGRCQELECVWCLHRYKIETYSWHSNDFRRMNARMTKKCFDPDPIVSEPIVVDKPHS